MDRIDEKRAALEVLDEALRAVGGHPVWHERQPINACPYCQMMALRARLAPRKGEEGK